MDIKEFKRIKKSYDDIPIVKFRDGDDIPMIYAEDIFKQKKSTFIVFGMRNLTHLDEVWNNFYNNYRQDDEEND